jgi:phage terminase small subunit
MIPLPKDPRHQRFADLLLQGQCNATEAYLRAGYKCSRKSAADAAKRLRRHEEVRAYMQAMQAKAAEATFLTMQEIRQFCARVVRTPITALDPHQEKDADLIKSYRTQESELGSSHSLEKLDPFKAIEIELKLSGNDPEQENIRQLAEAIGALASPVLPQDTL